MSEELEFENEAAFDAWLQAEQHEAWAAGQTIFDWPYATRHLQPARSDEEASFMGFFEEAFFMGFFGI
jgi:hypothetical protein